MKLSLLVSMDQGMDGTRCFGRRCLKLRVIDLNKLLGYHSYNLQHLQTLDQQCGEGLQEATERADPRVKKRDELVIPTRCGRQLYSHVCVQGGCQLAVRGNMSHRAGL